MALETMNPATVIMRLMRMQSLSVSALADDLAVPVSDVQNLLDGDSPAEHLIKPLADTLGVSERFIRTLYSASGRNRDVAISAVIGPLLATAS